jgi:hypothetical protein
MNIAPNKSDLATSIVLITLYIYNYIYGENPENSENNLFQCLFALHKSHTD